MNSIEPEKTEEHRGNLSLDRLEQTLGEAQARFDVLFSLAPFPVTVTTLEEGRFVAVNKAFCLLAGYVEHEVLGKAFSDLAIYVDASDRERLMVHLTSQGGVEGFETRFRVKDGTLLRVIISARRIPWDGRDHLITFTSFTTLPGEIQQAVGLNERRYHTILESISETYYEVDLAGRLTFFNHAASGLLGYTSEELKGKSYRDYTSPDEAQKVFNTFNEVYRTGTPVKFVEYAMRRKDGTEMMVETSASLLRDSQGRPIGFYGIMRNRTRQKKAEEMLRQSEESYRGLLELAPDAITVGSISDGRYLQVNDAFCRLSGYSVEEAIGRTALELNLYADPRDREEMLAALHRHGQVEGREIKFRTKSGHSLDTLTSARTIWFRGQACLLVIATNITALTQAQKALRQSEAKYRNILEVMEEGYYEVDLAGHFVAFNPSSLRFHGYPADELKGMHFSRFVAPENRVELEHLFAEMYRTGAASKILDTTILRKDGVRVIIEMSAYPLKDAAGQTIGFWGISRDRSEKRKMEAQLLQAKKMEAMGTLAGGIAHDFNNLLMGIQGNVNLAMIDLQEGHPLFERIKSIEAYVNGGINLTRQLLGAAKGGKYEVLPTDLNQLVGNSVDLFGRTKKEITIHKIFEEKLQAVEVDQGQIAQVLLNLFVNAWQAMPEGGDLYVETSNVRLDPFYTKPYGVPAGDYVKLSVTDTGHGIAPQDQKRIFDPFFTTKGLGGGSGLGLASAYGIVSNHGGIISVYSEKGAGATFNVYLPASEKTVIEPNIPKATILPGNETVLFVDDEEGIVEIARLILEKLGYTVIEAHGGRKAVEIYRRQERQIDIVILDMIMPGMSGSETFAELRAIDPHVKILLSSGYSITGQAQRIMEQGCNGFIQKPFNMQDLSLKVRQVLDGHKK
jgi:PAS domain S-box-containing protein